MKNIITSIILIGLLFFSYGCNESNSIEYDNKLTISTYKLTDTDFNTNPIYILWAGQHMNVGNLIISQVDDQNLSVSYKTTGACLTETHLHIADDPNNIPQKNGNAIPGQFDFKMENSDCLTEQPYMVPFDDANNDGIVYIAAHGVVDGTSSESEFSFPPKVEINYYGDENYGFASSFNININNPVKAKDTYDGWCMGYNIVFNEGIYSASAFNTYNDGELNPTLNHYKNLDLINWIINQHFVGKISECGEEFNLRDVQVAIWELLGQFTDPGWDDEFWADGCRVSKIIEMAKNNGVGFVPTCGEYMCVILEPDNGFQPVLIEVKIPCEIFGEETCWAGDENKNIGFPGKDWSMYIKYQLK